MFQQPTTNNQQPTTNQFRFRNLLIPPILVIILSLEGCASSGGSESSSDSGSSGSSYGGVSVDELLSGIIKTEGESYATYNGQRIMRTNQYRTVTEFQIYPSTANLPAFSSACQGTTTNQVFQLVDNRNKIVQGPLWVPNNPRGCASAIVENNLQATLKHVGSNATREVIIDNFGRYYNSGTFNGGLTNAGAGSTTSGQYGKKLVDNVQGNNPNTQLLDTTKRKVEEKTPSIETFPIPTNGKCGKGYWSNDQKTCKPI